MDDLLQQGVNSYKSGDKETARRLFISATKQTPDNEQAWGWLYNVCTTNQERIHCLNQVLRINPKNEKAKEMLDSIVGDDFPFDLEQKVAPPIAQTYSGNAEQNATPLTNQKPQNNNKALVVTSQKTINPKKQKNVPLVAIIGIVAIFFICGICSLVASMGGSSGNGTENSIGPTDASVMCEYFVKKQLKAPSTAKFPHYWELEITTYGKNEGVKDAFRVKGYVDAQNGFGAMIRSNYICDVQYIGNDNWNLINLTIE